MALLQSLVLSLDPRELVQVRQQLEQKRSNARKLLRLFNLMVADPEIPNTELIVLLYEEPKPKAFAKLCDRLTNELFAFIANQRGENSPTGEESLTELLSVSQHLLERQKFSAARHYLDKAEGIARENRQVLMLEVIYDLMANYAEKLEVPLTELEVKWNNNRRYYESFRRLKLAHINLREQIRDAKRKGLSLDPEEIVSRLIRNFDIRVEEANDASFMHEVARTIRSAAVPGKNYIAFERWVTKLYLRLSTAEAFRENHSEPKLGFLFMIAHALYRNRRFEEAKPWIEKFEALRMEKDPMASDYFLKMVSLKAAVASFTGNNQEAIDITEKILKSKSLYEELPEIVNMQLNLAVYFFQAKNFADANAMLYEIGHNVTYLTEKMGREWCFKKEMIQVIVYHEQGKDDLARRDLERMKVYYSEFLDQPVYKNAAVFISLISKMFATPEIVLAEKFREVVRESKDLWAGPKDDIQAITFFCWLKSKMNQKDYYSQLIETFSRMTELQD